MKAAFIFPGWGMPRKMYEVLDTGDYEKVFIDPGNEKYAVRMAEQEDAETIIIAWSMGTLSCAAILNEINTRKVVLISPTLKFTNSQPETAVKKMIRDLSKDSGAVLRYFAELNFNEKKNAVKFLREYGEELPDDVERLKFGLDYLITADNSELVFNENIEPLVIIAAEDEIIRTSDSQNAADKFRKKSVHILKGGHNIIYENTSEVNKLLRGYIDDREKQG